MPIRRLGGRRVPPIPRVRRIKALYKAQRFTFSDHALERKGQRSIDTVDIENLIRYGRLVGVRRDMKHAGPSYTIEGLSVDNES